MARAKPAQGKQPLVIRSLTLTPEADELLQHLSQDIADVPGWMVSSSAIVRALLRHVASYSKSATLSLA
jgi:hypothetical protein